MRRRDVAAASVPATAAMVVLGPIVVAVVSCLEALVSGGSPDVESAAMIAAFGWILGIFVAAVLAPIPVALAVFLWPDAEAEQGPMRAIDSVSLVVAATVMAELFLPVCIVAQPMAVALGVLLAYGVLAGVVTRIALRMAWASLPPWTEDSWPRGHA